MPNFFILFALTCVVLLAIAVVRPRLIYEYPYFMAATFTAFILPQAYALYRDQWGGIYLRMTLLICFLCIACCWLGYQRRPHPARSQRDAQNARVALPARLGDLHGQAGVVRRAVI